MWHRYFPRFCGRFFFSAIRVRGAEGIPATGPVLWLGLHRNGAVDGFVYAAALRRPLVFMISTQLRKNRLARIFFNGIAVARSNDEGDREANKAALGECIALLQRDGELFVFPEGTSSLGPRHLPFKAGAAQLALDWLDAGTRGGALRVLPVGIHYECAWAFRSAVEVVIGEPVDLALPEGMAALGRLRELKRRMSAGLEAVGANFSDAAAQREAEALATTVMMRADSTRSRFAILKACERGGARGLAGARCGGHARGCAALPRGAGVAEWFG
jgi:1-acyl-sn-glycerol-3-phosphate acyltransferase